MKRMPIITAVVVVIIIVAAYVMMQRGAQDLITAEQTLERADADTNVVLLDVRTEAEYKSETGHLAHAVLIPVQELEERLGELEPYKDKTIIAYCRTGNRSGKAASLLAREGYTALNMEGGIVRWNQLHFPVVKDSNQ